MWNKIKDFLTGKKIKELEERITRLEKQLRDLEELLSLRDGVLLEEIFEHMILSPDELFNDEELIEIFPSIFTNDKGNKDN